MEIWGKEFPLLGSVLGNNILRRNEGSRTGQWEKLNCHTALTKGSTSPAGNSEAGMALQRYPPKQARRPGFCPPAANSQRMWAALGKRPNLRQGNILWLRSVSRERLSTEPSTANTPRGRGNECLGHEGGIGTTRDRFC